ncbi:hypothetical protein [Nodosilinea nodulosa]|nr:hypothetical protein [Nodosilinea nodulosa]
MLYLTCSASSQGLVTPRLRVMTLMYSPLRPVGIGSDQATLSQ